MCTLMDIECDSATDEDKTEIVLDKMWQFNQTYSFAGFAQVGCVRYTTTSKSLEL